MRLISCYKSLSAEQQELGGVGQGGGNYWEDVVGIALQQQMILAAGEGGDSLVLSPRPHGFDSFDRMDYDFLGNETEFDLAYCQLFEVPKRRPAKIIYTILSDYLGMQDVLEDFLMRARPNFLISLQYPNPDLAVQCEKYGCKVIMLPWFNERNNQAFGTKTITAMCTGKMGGTYPRRDEIFKALEALNRQDVVLSGITDPTKGHAFKLTNEQYQQALASTKYYFSGGIYDFQIPPKYFEVCNYGACLVSPPLPQMEACGFVDGQTYIKLDSDEQIPGILDSEAWMKIGLAGQAMVHKRHSMQQRAKDILEVYNDTITP